MTPSQEPAAPLSEPCTSAVGSRCGSSAGWCTWRGFAAWGLGAGGWGLGLGAWGLGYSQPLRLPGPAGVAHHVERWRAGDDLERERDWCGGGARGGGQRKGHALAGVGERRCGHAIQQPRGLRQPRPHAEHLRRGGERGMRPRGATRQAKVVGAAGAECRVDDAAARVPGRGAAEEQEPVGVASGPRVLRGGGARGVRGCGAALGGGVELGRAAARAEGDGEPGGGGGQREGEVGRLLRREEGGGRRHHHRLRPAVDEPHDRLKVLDARGGARHGA